MFNKAIRKFTNLCKASFESEISAKIIQEEAEARKTIETL
jgi:hypothetical protein